MKKTKKILLTSIASVFLAATLGGIVGYNVNAAAENAKVGFYVEDGAAVRLQSEHEKFGIKFSAQVGEKVEGATYNILIVPVELVELYEADGDANKADIVTYLNAYAASKGGKLSIVENCEVKNDKIEGAIVNVLWKNINRKFVGVAYYEKDGVITVAQYADDKERSIVDVSQNALNSGDYTENADLKVLLEKMRYGKMVANGATEAEKESTAYQYEKFYGGSVSGNTVTTAVGTAITLSGLTGNVTNNVLQLGFDGNGSANGVTLDFGVIPEGTYRVQLAHTLVSGEFSSTITQNSNKELATVWETKELGNDLYEFYFTQDAEGQATFTISAENTAAAGTVTIDDISLEPVTVEELEYSREKYMFGIGGLAKDVNTKEGNWCDSKVTSEWMGLAANELGIESQRVWMSVAQIVKREETSNELSIDKEVANAFHTHFRRLQASGVKRIMVMLARFVYPYDYEYDCTRSVPDPNDEAAVYQTWLEMQYQAFKLLAKEFPEITLWECGNEYDLDTYMHKNGLESKESWELTRTYCFTNSEKAYITADICYAANKAFKLYNPESQVILPGMSKYATDKTNDLSGLTSSQQKYYFEELYNHIESGALPTLETTKISDPDKYFDIIAYHCYADSVDTFEAYNDTLMATAANHGDGDKRIWITEFGFTEEKFGGRGTEEAQNTIASLMGEMLTSLEQDKYKDLIEIIHFFRLSDTEGLITENVSESCFGIYYSPNASTNTGKAKPVAVTLYNYFNNASVTADDITFWKADFRQENFENVTLADTELLQLGPDVTLHNNTAELVDYNGSKALQVTRTTGEWAYVLFSVGAVEKGTYELELDAVTNGYNAIVQFLKLNGNVIQQGVNNYKTLFDLAKKDGDRYVLRVSISEDYADFGVALVMSGDGGGESIILDNVSWTKTNVIQSIDFEDGVVQKIAAKGDTAATIFSGYATMHISTDGNGAINLPNEIVTETDGNKYFTVNYKGWSSWSAFNFGFFKAGTYTITMDAKLISGTLNGSFIKRVGNSNVALTEGVDYTVDGDTYVFKITLEEDCMNFGIGYQCTANQNADFIIAYDNVSVTVGTNADGSVGDGYDWIDSIIN